MKTTNAIKKLEKSGFTVKQWERKPSIYSAYKRNYILNFHTQNDEAIIISTKEKSEERDISTDYFPETHHNNMKQAIESIDRQIERYKE